MTADQYSDAELIGLLRDEAGRIGRTPTVQHFNESPDLPAADTYKRRYAEWNNALWRAGLEPNEERYDRLALLDIYIGKSQEMDVDAPTWADIGADPDLPSVSTFAKEFTYSELLAELGLVRPEQDNRRWVDERAVYQAWEQEKDSDAVADAFGITPDAVQEAVAVYAF